MYLNLVSMLLPTVVSVIKAYIKSSSSKKDDVILDLVKDSVVYLSDKDNNTVDKSTCDTVLKTRVLKK